MITTMADEKLSQRLKEFRIKRGLQKSEIARQLGVSLPSYHGWEKGVSTPKDYMLRAIEQLLASEISYEHEVPLSEKLKKYRINRNLSKVEMAEMLGTSTSNYFVWEAGTAVPRDQTRKEIIAKLEGLESAKVREHKTSYNRHGLSTDVAISSIVQQLKDLWQLVQADALPKSDYEILREKLLKSVKK